MSHWVSLPPELRFLVLEFLAQEKRGLASYAQVCKEWQQVMEKQNFRRLKLQAPCLNDFNRMTSRNRALVQRVWLNIELQPYTCPSCETREHHSWTSDNDFLIAQAILKLFSILSTWGTAGNGLTLEISTQSPSDSEHWFKNHYFGTDKVDGNIIPETENKRQEPNPNHAWVSGQQVPSTGALLRLYETVDLVFPYFTENVPEVCAVTTFVVRRQCRRRFTTSSLQLLFERLPRLEHVVYEPWQAWDSLSQLVYDNDHETMVRAHLPKRTKGVSIFEDFNEDFIRLFQEAQVYPIDPIRVARFSLSAAFASKSVELEQLSVSFMVDAQYFFQAYQSSWTWGSLQRLSLTSRLLTCTGNPMEISNLFQDAGTIALRMPKLHTMALWNGGKEEACGFVYRRKGNSAYITLLSTWDMKLEPRVAQVWERTASQYGSCTLRIAEKWLSSSGIRSHGDAIHQLDLPDGVIDPMSLLQIRREEISWKRT